MVALGYKREDIEASLAQTRYDDVHATYLLISRKNTDVSLISHSANFKISKFNDDVMPCGTLQIILSFKLTISK